MKQPQSRRPSTRHEPLNYLAWLSQSVSLSLTPWRWCSLEKTCPSDSFAPQRAHLAAQKALEGLRSSLGMDLLCRLENSRRVALPLAAQSENDHVPDIRACMYSDRLTFPFSALTRKVLPCPILALCILLSELIWHVVQWFDTGITPRGFRVLSTYHESRFTLVSALSREHLQLV